MNALKYILSSLNLTHLSAYRHSCNHLLKSGFSTISRRKIYFETYGCQMNQNDADIARSLLKDAGHELVTSIGECDTVLLMTCSIRESAELKIWKRIYYFRNMFKRRKVPIRIGVLGCMAESLKMKLTEGVQLNTDISKENQTPIEVINGNNVVGGADFVCGPDAYRDLPHLIEDAHSGLTGASVALSLEETYADIAPLRRCVTYQPDSSELIPSPCAFLSVMRGCDNMCSYCIVPFVRGRERSRPLPSIIEETRRLIGEGVKEITLLGQNVNSYCDKSVKNASSIVSSTTLTPGFHTIYKPKKGGLRFVDLLEQISRLSAELRIRFTSPHPKDFPTEILQLIGERKNICSHLHLPAQSGSTLVLERMRRGYTCEAYLSLVKTVHEHITDVAITSDFIAGFCDETEMDHQQTIKLINDIKYSFCYCYPYSMREKTRAYHRLNDNVPTETKSRRHMELIVASRQMSAKFNADQIGQIQLVLVEGISRRSTNQLFGRNDFNIKVIFNRYLNAPSGDSETTYTTKIILPGDYVAVQITGATSQTLRGNVIGISSLATFNSSEWMNTTHLRHSKTGLF